MANFSITITDSLNLFGSDPASKWGMMKWGDKWAAGTMDEIQSIEKPIANSLSMSDSEIRSFQTVKSEEIILTDDMVSIVLIDLAGYYHVFRGQVTDIEDLIEAVWTESSNSGSSYTKQTASSTTWTRT